MDGKSHCADRNHYLVGSAGAAGISDVHAPECVLPPVDNISIANTTSGPTPLAAASPTGIGAADHRHELTFRGDGPSVSCICKECAVEVPRTEVLNFDSLALPPVVRRVPKQ